MKDLQVTLDGTMHCAPRPGQSEQMEIVAPNAKVRSLRVESVTGCWVRRGSSKTNGDAVGKSKPCTALERMTAYQLFQPRRIKGIVIYI